ncbi:hypothetical protein BDY17DRAFT_349125 [Neohortaea acidophila]|uniref:Uncharacterized protein n=1 Tax=Neohortaea acidophila TaxID=245834 RepID=A0A6A6PK01_9PEZI|nr:uncharacterized protein BDY17DRAFT_349125 [Neohortaea acidophila]KAF2479597.1 hypothetical protein BDY17DRAFT_349125 [Neohortaea acidophila]
MGGGTFLYPPCTPLSQRTSQQSSSTFNPKAVTEAAYLAAQDSPRSAQDGPLLRFDGEKVDYTPKACDDLHTRSRKRPLSEATTVNYNQHPDSWTVFAGHSVQYKPMPAHTKTAVTYVRRVQLGLRVLTELAAVGLLVAMILIQNISNVISWLLRVAPAWDVIATLYALYHLCRSATARTAASSASYHVFALVTDVALLPFYIIMCLNARANYLANPSDPFRWASLLKQKADTTDLLFATFTVSAVITGFHLVSACLDLYLALTFKKIASLPPDANPLEDNLTSRTSTRMSKHKYKNSEITLTGDAWAEKKAGFLSGSTLDVGRHSRLSHASKDMDDVEFHKIPFSHTRMRSTDSFLPHNPETGRLSRNGFEEVNLSRPASPYISRPSPLREGASRPHSSATLRKEVDITDFGRTASPALPNAAPSRNTIASQQKANLLHDNWYALDTEASDLDPNSRGPTPGFVDEEHGMNPSLMPQPLKMNPPTPPVETDTEYPDADNDAPLSSFIKRKPLATREDHGNADLSRNVTVISRSTTSSYYSDDKDHDDGFATDDDGVKGVATPKRKYYGDLAAATRGVLGTVKYKTTPASAGRILSNETVKSNGTIDAAAFDSTGFSALGGYGYAESPKKKKDRAGRVVSRTGVDIVDVAEHGFGRRREVSGKVAEEGRGGSSWWSRKGH